MKTAIDCLPDGPQQLKILLFKERQLTQQLKEKNQHLLEQFRLAQQQQFGKSSEAHPGQGELFNEAEQFTDEAPKKTTLRSVRNQPKRTRLPKDLPREIRFIDLADKEKVCDDCGHDLHRMGEKKSEQLVFIPGA